MSQMKQTSSIYLSISAGPLPVDQWRTSRRNKVEAESRLIRRGGGGEVGVMLEISAVKPWNCHHAFQSCGRERTSIFWTGGHIPLSEVGHLLTRCRFFLCVSETEIRVNFRALWRYVHQTGHIHMVALKPKNYTAKKLLAEWEHVYMKLPGDYTSDGTEKPKYQVNTHL